ncbi:Na+/H+ antiporter subunit E [Sanguibacter antarcticus]|uniref:Multisubunit sodium/proton antiporter MrpE subunit n=1 Tax=Sanguibacter antarcticus TaxID=372484 RepID=A0A2A9E857_9MICO|nr:Na+/H+ antiporter subunit E [Sanguibacter antarcticus]PFG35023.1 multisubunit sodium/proton antiporter MrpE subunit [Sanguibacter antarcticus]
MTIHRRRRSLRAHWPSIVWLTAVWMMLWGEIAWGNLVSGLLVASVVTVAMPLPAIDFHGRLRPLALAHLVVRFAIDLVNASVQVTMEAFRFGRTPRGAVVGVRLRSSSDLYLTLVAELSSLVPGSVVIEANRLTGMLYLHILNLEAYGGVEKVRDDVHALEDRVMRAIASDDELSRAGIARSARARPSSSTLPPTLPPGPQTPVPPTGRTS